MGKTYHSLKDFELSYGKNAIERANAVSYTHLDVYKRQLQKQSMNLSVEV